MIDSLPLFGCDPGGGIVTGIVIHIYLLMIDSRLSF